MRQLCVALPTFECRRWGMSDSRRANTYSRPVPVTQTLARQRSFEASSRSHARSACRRRPSASNPNSNSNSCARAAARMRKVSFSAGRHAPTRLRASTSSRCDDRKTTRHLPVTERPARRCGYTCQRFSSIVAVANSSAYHRWNCSNTSLLHSACRSGCTIVCFGVSESST